LYLIKKWKTGKVFMSARDEKTVKASPPPPPLYPKRRNCTRPAENQHWLYLMGEKKGLVVRVNPRRRCNGFALGSTFVVPVL